MISSHPISKQGLLLINKQEGISSFSLIPYLRQLTRIKKIGHTGTLDPLATGILIFLIGRNYTKKAPFFLHFDKEYLATIKLGQATTSYDGEGEVIFSSSFIPSANDITHLLKEYQGRVKQTPPMFSAKKIGGKKLYKLARKGITIKRSSISVHMKTTLIHYSYPFLELHIQCSSGTYIRSLAHDIGQKLGSGAFLDSLKRLRIGPFLLSDCIRTEELKKKDCQIFDWIKEYDFENSFSFQKETSDSSQKSPLTNILKKE